MAKVLPEPNSGCWLWDGGTDGGAGYGKMSFRGRDTGAHRASYELFCAPIPDGMQIDHLCRMPPCVNPAHLRVVTQAENLASADKAGLALGGAANGIRNRAKTQCPHGHSYADAIITGRGFRRCRTCWNRKEAARQQRLSSKGVP